MGDKNDIPRKKMEVLYADIIQEIQPLLDQLESAQQTSLDTVAQSEKIIKKLELSIAPAVEQIKFAIGKSTQQSIESINVEVKNSLMEANKVCLNVEKSRNSILFLVFFGGAIFGVLGGIIGALVLSEPILKLLT